MEIGLDFYIYLILLRKKCSTCANCDFTTVTKSKPALVIRHFRLELSMEHDEE
jgi:hypothetical protein